jgi:tripartite-type tricarboxylate transporter receptor subunit TctC
LEPRKEPQRLAILPPPQYRSRHDRGAFRLRGTPGTIVRKLHDAAVATMETPSVRERLKDIGATVVAPERRSPEYLQEFVESEIAKWAVPIKAANITGE